MSKISIETIERASRHTMTREKTPVQKWDTEKQSIEISAFYHRKLFKQSISLSQINESYKKALNSVRNHVEKK